MEAMEEALRTPMIVENILSFVEEDKDFLQCRLLNKFWDAEVLRAFPKREGIYLNLGTYIDETYSEGGPLLPQGSRMATRVRAGGEEDAKDPKDFLLFFRSGEGKGTEVLHLQHSIYKEDKGLTWGGALHEVLKNNLAPKLRELVLKFDPEGRVNKAFENGDQDLSASLSGLRVLFLIYPWTEIFEGSFTPFVAALLRGAENLEELLIDGAYFPQTADIATLRNLKVLKMDMAVGKVKSSWIPELERFLRDVSTHCPSLESLCLPFLVEESFEGLINLPRFPRLKQFNVKDTRRLPLDGDLTRFLREKMPLLRSLIADSASSEVPVESLEIICKALHTSTGSHNGLKYLATFAPNDPRHLEGLQTKFPSLKRLDLHGVWRTEEMLEEKPDADWLSELALVLATHDSLYSSITFYEEDEGEELYYCVGEEVRAGFLAAVGPDWRGTFRLSRVSSLEKELHLIP